MGAKDYAAKRAALINELRSKGITDETVLAALSHVPRELFMEDGEEAYRNEAVPIGLGQTISQPWIVGYMTALAGVGPLMRVLEVGTGSGYQTAVLSELASEVCTVERLAPLQEKAKKRLAQIGRGNVRFHVGDGSMGWPEPGTFDVIMVTAAAAKRVPPALLAQLSPSGGTLVAPVGKKGGDQRMLRVRRHGETYSSEWLAAVRFVPLVERP